MSGYAVAGFTAFTAAWYACKQITSTIARRNVVEDEVEEQQEVVQAAVSEFTTPQKVDTSIMDSEVTEVECHQNFQDMIEADSEEKQPIDIQMVPVQTTKIPIVTYAVCATQTEVVPVTAGCMCPACESKFVDGKTICDRTAEYVRARVDAHTPASISPVPSTAESGTTESVEATSTASSTPVPTTPVPPTTPSRAAKQFFSIATPELASDDWGDAVPVKQVVTSPAKVMVSPAKVTSTPGSNKSAPNSATKTNRIRGILTPEKRMEFAEKKVRVVSHVQKCLDRQF